MPGKKPSGPLNQEQLRSAALFYVGRYATTTSKLNDYLRRKVKERGWEDQSLPDYAGLVASLSKLNYVDDHAYAVAKIAALKRKGLGPQRIRSALYLAGIREADEEVQGEIDSDDLIFTALVFARRRRIGPYSQIVPDIDLKMRWSGALIRAGHSPDTARTILNLTLKEAEMLLVT